VFLCMYVGGGGLNALFDNWEARNICWFTTFYEKIKTCSILIIRACQEMKKSKRLWWKVPSDIWESQEGKVTARANFEKLKVLPLLPVFSPHNLFTQSECTFLVLLAQLFGFIKFDLGEILDFFRYFWEK
jgi:hypothetical protein